MFERFTKRARKVMVLAQNEARRLHHGYIGTEHILLGMIKEREGVAAQTLASFNVTLDAAREQAKSIVGLGEEEANGQIPFTPRSKKVLQSALREALHFGHNYIGTEHILIGLVSETEGVAARIFSNLNVDRNYVRREVVRRIGANPEPDPFDESEMEEAAENWQLFRGRIGSLQTSVRVGERPETLVVNLDYSYSVEDSNEQSEAMDHDGLLESVAMVLEGQGFRSVEAVVLKVGRQVLDGFPSVHEVEVSAVRERVRDERVVSGITVSHTFRR